MGILTNDVITRRIHKSHASSTPLSPSQYNTNAPLVDILRRMLNGHISTQIRTREIRPWNRATGQVPQHDNRQRACFVFVFLRRRLGEPRRVRWGDAGSVKFENHATVVVNLAVVEFVKGGEAVAAEEGWCDPVGAVDALDVGGAQ